MKLIYAGASPFVRIVMVVLEEAGQRDNVEIIDGMGSPVAPNKNALAANPVGKIPCLVLDNGSPLYDSRVITRYLNTAFKQNLYPTGEKEWETLTLEAHVNAMLDAAVLCVYETRCRNEHERSTDWLVAQRDKMNRGLDALENHWMTHLQGDLDIGHIAVGCALDYLDFRSELGGWSDWRAERPNLSNWANNFLNRASLKATAPS